MPTASNAKVSSLMKAFEKQEDFANFSDLARVARRKNNGNDPFDDFSNLASKSANRGMSNAAQKMGSGFGSTTSNKGDLSSLSGFGDRPKKTTTTSSFMTASTAASTVVTDDEEDRKGWNTFGGKGGNGSLHLDDKKVFGGPTAGGKGNSSFQSFGNNSFRNGGGNSSFRLDDKPDDPSSNASESERSFTESVFSQIDDNTSFLSEKEADFDDDDWDPQVSDQALRKQKKKQAKQQNETRVEMDDGFSISYQHKDEIADDDVSFSSGRSAAKIRQARMKRDDSMRNLLKPEEPAVSPGNDVFQVTYKHKDDSDEEESFSSHRSKQKIRQAHLRTEESLSTLKKEDGKGDRRATMQRNNSFRNDTGRAEDKKESSGTTTDRRPVMQRGNSVSGDIQRGGSRRNLMQREGSDRSLNFVEEEDSKRNARQSSDSKRNLVRQDSVCSVNSENSNGSMSSIGSRSAMSARPIRVVPSMDDSVSMLGDCMMSPGREVEGTDDEMDLAGSIRDLIFGGLEDDASQLSGRSGWETQSLRQSRPAGGPRSMLGGGGSVAGESATTDASNSVDPWDTKSFRSARTAFEKPRRSDNVRTRSKQQEQPQRSQHRRTLFDEDEPKRSQHRRTLFDENEPKGRNSGSPKNAPRNRSTSPNKQSGSSSQKPRQSGPQSPRRQGSGQNMRKPQSPKKNAMSASSHGRLNGVEENRRRRPPSRSLSSSSYHSHQSHGSTASSASVSRRKYGAAALGGNTASLPPAFAASVRRQQQAKKAPLSNNSSSSRGNNRTRNSRTVAGRRIEPIKEKPDENQKEHINEPPDLFKTNF